MFNAIGKFIGSGAAFVVNSATALKDGAGELSHAACEAYRAKRAAAQAQEGPKKARRAQNEVEVIPDQLEHVKTASRRRAPA